MSSVYLEKIYSLCPLCSNVHLPVASICLEVLHCSLLCSVQLPFYYWFQHSTQGLPSPLFPCAVCMCVCVLTHVHIHVLRRSGEAINMTFIFIVSNILLTFLTMLPPKDVKLYQILNFGPGFTTSEIFLCYKLFDNAYGLLVIIGV